MSENGNPMSDESNETLPQGDEAAGAKASETAASDAPREEKKPVAPPPKPSGGDWVFLVAVSVVTAGLDLWSKYWALNALSRSQSHPPPLCTPPQGMSHYLPQRLSTREVVLIRDYLDFQYAENCGGAWGLLHGTSEAIRRPFFLLVTLGAIVFIVHLYRTLEKGQSAMKWALPLVLGGAIGNLVDRIRLGYVVDFIHAHWRMKAHWPTFNVADIAITVGIGLMLLEYILGPRREAKERAAKKAVEVTDAVKPVEPPAAA